MTYDVAVLSSNKNKPIKNNSLPLVLSQISDIKHKTTNNNLEKISPPPASRHWRIALALCIIRKNEFAAVI
jgi:hypothetical protein